MYGDRGARGRDVAEPIERDDVQHFDDYKAIVCLFLIPVCLVTFVLQNQLLRGVTFGTIKR